MNEDINYTKEAFLNPWNLTFLIVAMLTTLILIGDGPWQEMVLLFAAAAELLYLGMVPRDDRFRRAIRAQRAAEHAKPPSQKDIFRLLSKSSQKRYVRLRNLEKSIETNYQKFNYATQGLLGSHLKKIDGLLDSYLNLLYTKERYERFTLYTTEDEVVRAMAEIRRDMQDDQPKVRSIKERRLKILERRLDRFKKAHENLEVIEAQLATIEDVTKYIHEQSLTMRNPEEITFQLDTLLSEVEETQASVEEIEDVFTQQPDLLSDLESFSPESEAAPPEHEQLPRQTRLRSGG